MNYHHGLERLSLPLADDFSADNVSLQRESNGDIRINWSWTITSHEEERLSTLPFGGEGHPIAGDACVLFKGVLAVDRVPDSQLHPAARTPSGVYRDFRNPKASPEYLVLLRPSDGWEIVAAGHQWLGGSLLGKDGGADPPTAPGKTAPFEALRRFLGRS